MYFTVIWSEPRFITNKTVDKDTYTPIDLNFLNHLWVPNIFIYDLQSFAAMSVLKKLAGVFIVGDDRVYYNQVCALTLYRPECYSITVALNNFIEHLNLFF